MLQFLPAAITKAIQRIRAKLFTYNYTRSLKEEGQLPAGWKRQKGDNLSP